ncbi:MAG: sugar phosphate isomerase/epimerase family protein [Clostridia bacterium]|nr:sugar phosphate isomerase/epimerase family protein [Clostridia bacterium]
MARIGLCMLMLASAEDPLAERYIPAVRQAGYDYAEISLSKLYGLEEGALWAYRDAFGRAGLPTEAFNDGMPPFLCVLGDKSAEAAWQAYIDRAVQLAKFFGVSTITTSAPHSYNAQPGVVWEKGGKQQYAAFLRRFSQACAPEGITIAIEPICRREKGFVNRIAQALELIGLVGADNLKLVPDLFHMRMEGEDASCLPALVRDGRIAHLHYSDAEERGFPCSARKALYLNELQPVLDAGFAGRISVEAVPKHPLADIASAFDAISFCKAKKGCG